MNNDVIISFALALKKWKLYDNKICHKIQVLVSGTDFNNHNFYEFAKGFVFASLGSNKEIQSLKTQLGKTAKLIGEIDVYLDHSESTFISHKSLFHREMKHVLVELKKAKS